MARKSSGSGRVDLTETIVAVGAVIFIFSIVGILNLGQLAPAGEEQAIETVSEIVIAGERTGDVGQSMEVSESATADVGAAVDEMTVEASGTKLSSATSEFQVG